jgi:hypothetical protein
VALPRFVRYDGRRGVARKQAEEAEWLAKAAARDGGAVALG